MSTRPIVRVLVFSACLVSITAPVRADMILLGDTTTNSTAGSYAGEELYIAGTSGQTFTNLEFSWFQGSTPSPYAFGTLYIINVSTFNNYYEFTPSSTANGTTSGIQPTGTNNPSPGNVSTSQTGAVSLSQLGTTQGLVGSASANAAGTEYVLSGVTLSANTDYYFFTNTNTTGGTLTDYNSTVSLTGSQAPGSSATRYRALSPGNSPSFYDFESGPGVYLFQLTQLPEPPTLSMVAAGGLAWVGYSLRLRRRWKNRGRSGS